MDLRVETSCTNINVSNWISISAQTTILQGRLYNFSLRDPTSVILKEKRSSIAKEWEAQVTNRLSLIQEHFYRQWVRLWPDNANSLLHPGLMIVLHNHIHTRAWTCIYLRHVSLDRCTGNPRKYEQDTLVLSKIARRLDNEPRSGTRNSFSRRLSGTSSDVRWKYWLLQVPDRLHGG